MNEPTREPVVLDKAGAAQVLGKKYRPDGTPFTTRMINNWMKQGLPHAKIGRDIAIDRDELLRWADRTFHRGVRF